MRIHSLSSRPQGPSWASLISSVLLGSHLASAIDLDINNDASIKRAAKTAADGMMGFYTGNRTGDVPGNLPQPYYWWEAGAAFGALIDYYFYTGNSEYNEVVTQGMLHQTGPNFDYMPPNQTKTEGNDDQAFWGMAALSAAENVFPDPPAPAPGWLALAQAVFNSQTLRWDNATCGGGLRWQIFTFNNGYNYKNTISNGCFFNMASRLATYTGNHTYALWADTMWDWTQKIGLVDKDYKFFDGTDANNGCIDNNHIQWSYNAGVYLLGAANMYNYTNGAPIWKDRIDKILDGINIFFQNSIMYEVACEINGKCNVDQRSFKAYLARWMAGTIKVAPYTTNRIMPLLQTSAQAAAKQCTGSIGLIKDAACGMRWTTGSWDGNSGVGEQMSALEIFQVLLTPKLPPPATAKSGGKSRGNPLAGLGGDSVPNGTSIGPVTTGDKAGAGILTAIILIVFVGGAIWMVR
ncbi:MAG: hydrolase 76 protein [Vezdaea aestivalis]|nr:MAG: hydrolase 76 protein [Vezdaea aestivalis]